MVPDDCDGVPQVLADQGVRAASAAAGIHAAERVVAVILVRDVPTLPGRYYITLFAPCVVPLTSLAKRG